MEKHLWHHWGTIRVRSECGLTPGTPVRVHRQDLAFDIDETTCMQCLLDRQEHARRMLAECAGRIASLINMARTNKGRME